MPPIISPPEARELTLRELHEGLAGAGIECMLPTMPGATQEAADRACDACPLSAGCRELRIRQERVGACYQPTRDDLAAARTTAPTPAPAGRPRRIRKACGRFV